MTCGPHYAVGLQERQQSHHGNLTWSTSLPSQPPEVQRCCHFQARRLTGEDLEVPLARPKVSHSLLSAMCTPVPGAGTSGRPPGSTSQEDPVRLALVSGDFLDEGAGWVMALCRGPRQSVCGPHAGAGAKHLYGFPDR